MKKKSLRILWLKTGPLHPLDSGGKLRTYHMLRELSRRHHITYLTLVSDRVPPDWKIKAAEYAHQTEGISWKERPKSSFVSRLDLLLNTASSRYPYVVEKYRSPLMKRRINQLEKQADLVVCDFLAPAINVNGLIAPSLIFEHNVESQIWERRYRMSKGPIKFLVRMQWHRMLQYEKEACRKFDGIVAVSARDQEMLKSVFRLEKVLGYVPTGVDTAYFKPDPMAVRRPHQLVFTGSMDWHPNEDAVLWFVRRIYPELKSMVPDAALTVAGRDPSPKMKQLQKEDRSISVTGSVEDIRPYMASASAMIVPLRIGGGTRIKIFEGMAMGLPVISTSIGAEGLPLENGRNILIADDPNRFAQAAAKILLDPPAANRIAADALSLVRNRYSWSSVARIFETYCLKLVHEAPGGLAPRIPSQKEGGYSA